MSLTGHHHKWALEDTDDNSNRVRWTERCADCGETRMGTVAKRLDDEGRQAWGPVAVVWYA